MHRHRLASVLGFAVVLALTAFFAPLVRGADDKPKDSAKSEALKEGTPDLKSAGPLAFGPSGILFVADPIGAAVFAIDVGEADSSAPVKDLSVEQIDVKVSALLGTSPKEIEIRDLAVQPGSGKAYLSVMRGLGPNAAAVIVRVASPTDIRAVSLDKVRFAKASLPDAPADAGAAAGGGDGGKGRRGQNQRLESITDLAYIEGRLLSPAFRTKSSLRPCGRYPTHSPTSRKARASRSTTEPTANSRLARRSARSCHSRSAASRTFLPLTRARRS
jgi:hypothetical protein